MFSPEFDRTGNSIVNQGEGFANLGISLVNPMFKHRWQADEEPLPGPPLKGREQTSIPAVFAPFP
jgi:hypothetical protein